MIDRIGETFLRVDSQTAVRIDAIVRVHLHEKSISVDMSDGQFNALLFDSEEEAAECFKELLKR